MPKRSARVVINRKLVNGIVLAVADGLFEVGKEIITEARPPDSPYDPFPAGEGLPKQGGVLAYVDGQKVGGWSQRGTQPRKPRAARGSTGVAVFAGFGFPGRFAHNGTVNHAGTPFLATARDRVMPRMVSIVRQHAAYRIKRLSGA